MSLWTPGGEVPVDRNRGSQPEPERQAPGGAERPVISEEALAEAAAAAGIDLADLSPEERAAARDDDARDGRRSRPSWPRPPPRR